MNVTTDLQHETNSKALKLVTDLALEAIRLARANGYRENPALLPEERAEKLLKAGIPLVLADPKYAKLIM